MSKITLALVAAAGAATGAIATAAAFSSSRREKPGIAPTSSTPITITSKSLSTPLSQPLSVSPAIVDPSGIYQYGFPGPVSDIRAATSLTSSFNRQTRNPHWVAEHITRESLSQHNADRKHSVFAEDAAIPPAFRAKLKDYFRSGYDRGHQVPAADAKWSQQAMDDTFLLSNMCPQVGDGFNRDYWAFFEDFCRRLAGRYPSVRIVTGPLYLPKRGADDKWRVEYEVIGNPPNVAVPTHFYKVIYGEEEPGSETGKVALAAFVLPNAPISKSKPLQDFEVPVEAVERASGLEFVKKLEPVRRKSLCKEVACSIVVREYKDRQKQLLSPQVQSS